MSIVFVFGANHSGTSCVAKALLDLGGSICEYEGESPELPYVKYEDSKLRAWCRARLNIEDFSEEKLLRNKLLKHFRSLDPCKTWIMKYPKSVFLLDELNLLARDHERVFVYVWRYPADVISSTYRKTGTHPDLIGMELRETERAINEFKFPFIQVSFENIKAELGLKELARLVGLDGG